MNSKERIQELKLKIYNTVVNNNWRLTVVTFDDQIYSGGLVKQRELDESDDVIITIINDENNEINIRLKNIKEIRE